MYYLDAHLHISPVFRDDAVLRFMDRTETEKAVLQAVWHSQYGPLAPDAMAMKKAHPDRFRVFGAPDMRLYAGDTEHIGRNVVDSLRPLIEQGMDGVKFLEGKPIVRKRFPLPPFDSEAWEPFFAYLEENGIPITWHINDPASFWAKDASPWLIKQGWAYDESFIHNETQYAEALRVLDRHKQLKVIFAHFYFMSESLDRLAKILDAHPAVCVDLTPGIEMYENFSADIGTAAAFFARYQDRILYGTDIGGRCILTNEGCPFNEQENLRRPEIVRYFLTGTEPVEIRSDGNYIVDRKPFTLRPLGLNGARLEQIAHGNAEKVIG